MPTTPTSTTFEPGWPSRPSNNVPTLFRTCRIRFWDLGVPRDTDSMRYLHMQHWSAVDDHLQGNQEEAQPTYHHTRPSHQRLAAPRLPCESISLMTILPLKALRSAAFRRRRTHLWPSTTRCSCKSSRRRRSEHGHGSGQNHSAVAIATPKWSGRCIWPLVAALGLLEAGIMVVTMSGTSSFTTVC